MVTFLKNRRYNYIYVIDSFCISVKDVTGSIVSFIVILCYTVL